jgi:hypothetical protein
MPGSVPTGHEGDRVRVEIGGHHDGADLRLEAGGDGDGLVREILTEVSGLSARLMIAPGAFCMIAAKALIGISPTARERMVPVTSVSEVSACPVAMATSVPMELGPPERNSASIPSSSK